MPVSGRELISLDERHRGALDRLITAHAVSVGASLVTNNEADFKDYPGLDDRGELGQCNACSMT